MRDRKFKRKKVEYIDGWIKGEGKGSSKAEIGLYRWTDAWQVDAGRYIYITRLGEKWRREERMKGKRWVARRLSNYPFKPNLRCSLKLTYANGEAGWQRGLLWLRLHYSEISFHILSQYYQMQILWRHQNAHCNFLQEAFFSRHVRVLRCATHIHSFLMFKKCSSNYQEDGGIKHIARGVADWITDRRV